MTLRAVDSGMRLPALRPFMAACLGWLATRGAAAQPAPQPAPQPAAQPAAQPPAAPVVTRADLAAAYQRVDGWLVASPPDSATAVLANRRFDQGTLAFFAGRTADAIRALNRLYAHLAGDTATDGDMARTLGLRASAAPAIPVRGTPGIALALVPLVPMPGTAPLPLRVRLVDARNRDVATTEVAVAPGASAPIALPFEPARLARLTEGRYALVAAVPGRTPDIRLGHVDIARESPDSTRARLAARTAALDSITVPQAVAAFRARLANLVATPSPEQSAQFLSDPATLARALGREAETLAAGRDPYVGAGDVWRTIIGPGGRPLPMRIIVPAGGDSRAPRPLVVALHGAGGDENMFPDAYGAGEVVRQAARRGAILVSPATTVFQRDVAMLDSVLAVVSRAYAVDSTRVYVIGHSMGAAATYAAAAARPSRIAATVLLAGAGRPPAVGTRVPPSLWIAGGLDPIIPPSRIRPAAEAAGAAGASVTYREHPTAGHTLGVGPMLAEAFEFLFARRLGAP